MRTSNPIFNSKVFGGTAVRSENAMSVQGTINKTALLLGMALFTSILSWTYVAATPSAATGLMILGAIGGLVCALATAFAPQYAMFTAPAYALLEGAFLGSISVLFEASYPGIAFQAIGLTFGVMAAMLMAYTSGVIQVTERFRMGIMAATGGIALFYFSAMILSFFGVNMGFVFGSGLFGIAFSLFVVAIAALNLALDFDFIDRGSQQGLPKQMEWIGAFGLMVTLVWLYIEILRLLSKLRDNR